jgi:hypothetical protein
MAVAIQAEAAMVEATTNALAFKNRFLPSGPD